ncbi:hypothetical protein HGB07_06115 [Candidatus Roizmanbacteria bacterium]|nr:hypothetical protein [Candidatus Roizmanbacteria bacterium]
MLALAETQPTTHRKESVSPYFRLPSVKSLADLEREIDQFASSPIGLIQRGKNGQSLSGDANRKQDILLKLERIEIAELEDQIEQTIFKPFPTLSEQESPSPKTVHGFTDYINGLFGIVPRYGGHLYYELSPYSHALFDKPDSAHKNIGVMADFFNSPWLQMPYIFHNTRRRLTKELESRYDKNLVAAYREQDKMRGNRIGVVLGNTQLLENRILDPILKSYIREHRLLATQQLKVLLPSSIRTPQEINSAANLLDSIIEWIFLNISTSHIDGQPTLNTIAVTPSAYQPGKGKPLIL